MANDRKNSTAETRFSISIQDEPIAMEKFPRYSIYRALTSSGKCVTLDRLVSKLVSGTCNVSRPLDIVSLHLDLDQDGGLNGFSANTASVDGDGIFPLEEVIGLVGIPVEGLVLPSIAVGLSELSFNRRDQWFEMKGAVKAGERQAETELNITLLPENEVELELGFHSQGGSALTLDRLIRNALPPSFQELLPSPDGGSENLLLQNLRQSGLSDLQLYLNSEDETFSLFAEGTVITLKGAVRFSVDRYIDRRMVSFKIYGDEETNLKSIPEVFKDTLGLDISGDVESYLPKMRFALTELSFDQFEEIFRLQGIMAQGNAAQGESGYRLACGLGVEWRDGLVLNIDLDAQESPVVLSALEQDLPFSLDEIKAMLPRRIVDKIGATEFHSLDIYVDTTDWTIGLDGMAGLFGELLINGAFYFSKSDGLKLDVKVYADPLPLRELPGLVGLGDICGREVTDLLPDISIGLNQVVLDQSQKLFSIGGTVGIGEGGANTNFAIQKHPQNGGVIINLGFEGYADKAPSLIDLLGAVIPGVNASDVRLPGNFDITLQTLNLRLDTVKKSLTGEADGFLIISNVPLYLSAKSAAQGDPWIFAGNSEPGKRISLTGLSSDILRTIDTNIEIPKGIPEIYFEDLAFSINTKTKEFSFKCDANVAGTVKIQNKDCALSLGIDVNYNPEKEADKLTGILDGSLRIGEIDFLAELNLGSPALSLKLEEGDRLNFREVAEFLLGEELFNELPEDLAQNLAGVEVTRFDSNIDFENKGFFLDTCTTIKNIKLGTDDLLIKEAIIALKLDVSDKKTYCKVEVGGAGNIGSAINFEGCRFTFEYDRRDGKTDWTLAGLFDAEILGHKLEVEAGYKDVAGTKTMSLNVKDPFPAIVFPGVGSFELDDFALMVEKKEGEKTAWGLSTTFQLKTDADIFDLRNGTVALINDADKSGLKLSADGIDMKIPGLEHLPWFSMDQAVLELVYDKSGKQWSCHGKTGFVRHNVPDMLTRIFPVDNVFAECTINNTKAEFSVGLEDGEGLIQIPAPMDVGDFGHAYIGINELKIDLMNGGSLTAKLKFGLPKGLNTIFQPDPEAEDALEIFRVYDPDKENKEEGLLGLDLIISAEEGLMCRLDQSPFKFFDFKEESGRKIIDFDLKEFGHFSIDIPEFSLQPDGGFKASGGFDIKKDLRFPLTPFKFLLEKIIKLSDPEAVLPGWIPDGIPIKGIKFYSEKEGFETDAFFDLFMLDGVKVPLPDWLREGFDAVDDIMNRLPKEFLKYGNVEIPKHLHFNIDFSADGSFSFQLSVKDPAGKEEAVPLKLLIPNFPAFIGIELYGIAFGEMFGGALLRLDLDVKIDIFDLPSLLASLLLPYEDLKPEIRDKLPDPGNLQNTFRAENLLIAIVYETQIPIPIPLFYDNLGIIYKGLNGIEVESFFSFPKPRIDVKDFILLFSELKGFFTEKEKRLDLEKIEEEITFGNFTVGPNYLRFPKYISIEEDDPKVGKLLGTKEGFTISPAKLIGALLNAIKFGSVNDLIRVVDVERRVGEIDLKIFDILTIHYEYAFTTPFEFIDDAYKKLSSFSQTQAKEFIEILPPRKTGLPEKTGGEYRYETTPVTEDTQGLVVFLKGDLNIADALLFDTGFGLVATGEGFGLGMQFNGSYPGIFDVHMKGVVAMKKDGGYLLEGGSHVRILDRNILYGHFRFSNEEFQIEAKAGDGPIRVAGKLAGAFTNDLFHLKGDVSLLLLGLKAEGAAEILFRTDDQNLGGPEKKFDLHGDFSLGEFLTLTVTLQSHADVKQAGMSIEMAGRLSHLLDVSLTGAVLTSERALKAEGSASMKILDREVITSDFSYGDNAFAFHGRLDLFPENDLLEVKGDVDGYLSNEKFALAGDCNVTVLSCGFAEARVLITDTEMALAAKLFDLAVALYVQKNDTGYRITGTMAPIVLGTLLKITRSDKNMDAGMLGGARIEISDASPYFMMDGKVSLLGIEASVDIHLRDGFFLFEVQGELFDLIKGRLKVSADNFENSDTILIEGEIEIGDLTGEVSRKIRGFAGEINTRMEEAKTAVAIAEEGVRKAGEKAAGEIERLTADLKTRLTRAEDHLTAEESKVNPLNERIHSLKGKIKKLKAEIEAKKKWYNHSAWYEKAFRWVELGAYVTAKGVEMAALYAEIGALETAKLAALGVLEIAKAAVRKLREAVDAAGKTARDSVLGITDLAAKGLEAARDALEALRNTFGGLVDWSTAVLDFTGSLFTINRAKFSSGLNTACAGNVMVEADVTFLGTRRTVMVNFNLTNPGVGVTNLVEALKGIDQNPSSPDNPRIER